MEPRHPSGVLRLLLALLNQPLITPVTVWIWIRKDPSASRVLQYEVNSQCIRSVCCGVLPHQRRAGVLHEGHPGMNRGRGSDIHLMARPRERHREYGELMCGVSVISIATQGGSTGWLDGKCI